MRILFLSLIMSLVFTAPAEAEEIRVAVAANFRGTLENLAQVFSGSTDHEVIISSGSTGRHYAQIINGAPFDIFLAADAARPELLVNTGVVTDQQRFDYAYGQLVLWKPGHTLTRDTADWLEGVTSIAIANPRLAPYGQAAQQTLSAITPPNSAKLRVITGENVSQTFQFVASGNVDAGFVALPQIYAAEVPAAAYQLIPSKLYEPIRQQGVLLSNSIAAADFVIFLRTPEARAIIRSEGYTLPELQRPPE